MHRRAAKRDDVRTILDGVRHVVRVLRVSARAAERRVGVSGAQLYVLHQLAERPAASLNALAARTHTHQSSVSVVVARLVRQGLVERRVSAADGRRIELALTAAGRGVVRRAPAAAQERLVVALRRLPAAERAQLAEGLSRLVRSLGVAGQTPGMFFEEGTDGSA